jgi:hypothetical protein
LAGEFWWAVYGAFTTVNPAWPLNTTGVETAPEKSDCPQKLLERTAKKFGPGITTRFVLVTLPGTDLSNGQL